MFPFSRTNIRRLPILSMALAIIYGCLFETNGFAFDGKITEATLVRRDGNTVTYSIRYSGWSTLDSLGVLVHLESCRQSARYVNNRWESLCRTHLPRWGSGKTYPSGRFEGVENVTWTSDRGDSAFVQLKLFEKPKGTIGFSQRVNIPVAQGDM